MSKRFDNCEGVPDNTEVTLSVFSRRSRVTTFSGNSSLGLLQALRQLFLSLKPVMKKKSMTHHLPQTPPLQRTKFFDGEATRVAYFLS